MSSNRIEFQGERLGSAGVVALSARHGEPYFSIELRITNSLRMQAVRATFLGLPEASSRQQESRMTEL